MALSHYYVSPASGSDATGDGSIGTPWKTVQHALNNITRNATDGDQINVQAGAADVLSASLSLATYGTPTGAAPLVLRGYTSAAGDGGVGVLSGGGVCSIIAHVGLNYTHLCDLRLTNTGANYVVGYLYNYSSIVNCEVDTSSSHGILTNGVTRVVGCNIHDIGAHGIYAVPGTILYNRVSAGSGAGHYCIALSNPGGIAIGNVVTPAHVAANGIYGKEAAMITDNSIRALTGGTGAGIEMAADAPGIVLTNNVIAGFSGAGGRGIAFGAGVTAAVYRSNALYNNTTPVSGAPKVAMLAGNNDTLAADPFVDAAGGDYRIKSSSAAAAAAWPEAWPGLPATLNARDIGAAQNAPSGGGGRRRRLWTFGG